MTTGTLKQNHKTVHKNCGGDIEKIALLYGMGVKIKCKKCGEAWTRIESKISS